MPWTFRALSRNMLATSSSDSVGLLPTLNLCWLCYHSRDWSRRREGAAATASRILLFCQVAVSHIYVTYSHCHWSHSSAAKSVIFTSTGGDLKPRFLMLLNPLMLTLKLHSNGLLHSYTVIGALAIDGWAVTFGTARRGPSGLPSSLYQM